MSLHTLWAMTAVEGCFHRLEWRNGGPWHAHDFPAENERRYVQCATRLGELHDVLLSAAPRSEPGLRVADRAMCLWARTESKKQQAALRRFNVKPTVCLQEGDSCRLVALWALSDVLEHDWLVRANRRIAHHLGTAKKHADPGFMFPAPGTCLRHGRSRPALVREWVNPNLPIYSPAEVVGHLKEAPSPDAWRERAAA